MNKILDWGLYMSLLLGLIFFSFMLGNIDARRHYQCADADGFTEIENIIQQVHDAHDYVISDNYMYVCANYTMDAMKEIKKLNKPDIHTYYISAGLINSTDRHAWIRVCRDYDVTSGVYVPDYDMFEDITVYKEKEENGTNVLVWSGYD